MKKESQIAILKSIVAFQADEIEALEKRLAERDELTGTVDGLDDVTLRVQVQSPDEHATAKALRWGKATVT